jgi:hypothetical protein
MGHRARPNFDRIAPVSDRYALLPVAEAFDWAACAADVPPGEWYMVAFRSIRRAGADEARLTAYDDFAHAEAMGSPGFVHYFKGPTEADGRCLSFCLWTDRATARAASGRPAHVAAAGQTHETYEVYSLEFHRVRRLEGDGGFTFEPYDMAETLRLVEPPAPAPGFAAGLAPS